MDLTKTFRILILIIVLVGLVAAVILVRRQQRATGEATSLPTPSPLVPVYLPQDFNRNGLVNEEDFLIFKQKYNLKDPAADLDRSGDVNSLDYNLFLSKIR